MVISSIARRLFRAVAMLLAFSMPAVAADMSAMPAKAKKAKVELGASAAFAPNGLLYAVAKQGEHLLLYRSKDEGVNWLTPVVVNAQPEAISADGENRPKLAFTREGAVLVSWTKPLSKPNTGEIRFARSDDGEHFFVPITVHQDRAEITHRFESMLVAVDGRVLLAWIDKRDLEKAKAGKEAYSGAAIYIAISTDGGRSFQPEKNWPTTPASAAGLLRRAMRTGRRSSCGDMFSSRMSAITPLSVSNAMVRRRHCSALPSTAGKSTAVRITAPRWRSIARGSAMRCGLTRKMAKVASFMVD